MSTSELHVHPATSEIDAIESGEPEHRYFARQPILDRNRAVFGHEFLFRSGSENYFAGDAQDATRHMVDNSILYDFEWLAGGGKAFLNCTRTFLTGHLVKRLPRRSTVLELPDDVEADDEVIEACRSIRGAGYQLALSNFEPRPGIERLLPLADYIKVDFRRSEAGARRGIVQLWKSKDLSSRLVAEKVETEEEFHAAEQEGFHLFQGFFFCAPAMSARDQIPANTLSRLSLLAAINKPDFDWWEIERLVRNDPALLYRLLRLVNSAATTTSGEVTSVHAALVLLGETRFRKVALLGIATELAGDKPSELLILALQRANFCELAAHKLYQDPSEQYLFGLISLLPALLGTNVQQVVDLLPLSAPVKAAMLGESNGIAAALHGMHRYEMGPSEESSQWDDDRSGLKDEDVERWYHESLVRAHQAVHAHTV